MLSHLRALILDLSDPHHPSTEPIVLCDPSCHRQLLSYANNLAQRQHADSIDPMQSLLQSAHEYMSTATPSFELYGWRRIYTDASILKALALAMNLNPLSAISALDYAIIIAGAAGLGRLELIHALIRHIQLTDFPTSPFFSDSIPSVPSCHVKDDVVLSTAEHRIPELSEPPSFLAFQEYHSCHPFIIRNYADNWPALRNHPWGTKSYLKSVSGKGRIVPIEKGSDYRADNWTQLLMSWDEFLDTLNFEYHSSLEYTRATNDIFYLAQHNLMAQFPSLRDDVMIPDYVYASLSNSDYPQYKPPQNEEQLVMNVWLGPKGTVSPAHVVRAAMYECRIFLITVLRQDPYYNLYVQVHGRKTVWLAPPSMTSFLKNTKSTVHTSQSDDKSVFANTSLCNVFDSDKASNDDSFWENVPPNAMAATLNAGDLLFFPPGWWHAMRSEATSFSLSIWF